MYVFQLTVKSSIVHRQLPGSSRQSPTVRDGETTTDGLIVGSPVFQVHGLSVNIVDTEDLLRLFRPDTETSPPHPVRTSVSIPCRSEKGRGKVQLIAPRTVTAEHILLGDAEVGKMFNVPVPPHNTTSGCGRKCPT